MKRRNPKAPPSRRQFLRGLGGFTLGLPFLPSLLPRSAWGQGEGQFPTRLIIFHTANGQPMRMWTPTGLGADYQLSQVLAPLQNFRDDLIVIRGLNMVAAIEAMSSGLLNNGHAAGTAVCLTGATPSQDWGGGISVDQLAAQRIGTTTPLRSLELAVDTVPDMFGRISYLGAGQPVPPQTDPKEAFKRVFSGFSQDQDDPRLVTGLNPRDATILDMVKGDYDRIKGRLAPSDRSKLDQHLEQVRALEERLKIPLPAVGANCVVPDEPASMHARSNPDVFPTVGKLQMDLLVMALACDVTRVGSLVWQEGANNMPFTFLPQPIYESHHAISHTVIGEQPPLENPGEEALTQINRWFAEQFAYLLGQLKSIPEGKGSLLDHSVVVWTNELSDGFIHNHENMPFVIAGKGGNYFNTGRYIEAFGKPHNDMWVSVLHALGLEDVNDFGEHGSGGPLAGLSV